ncbi:MAG: hypothetical protein KIS79_03820 [Burkholderiales bacterium]|nr:hypothetical protein [Burkholderiales bacterium]
MVEHFMKFETSFAEMHPAIAVPGCPLLFSPVLIANIAVLIVALGPALSMPVPWPGVARGEAAARA